MKQTALLILMISVTILSYGQKKIKKLEVKEEGFNVKMSFKPVVDEVTYNGITFKITPISTEELNSIFLKESALNGKFEYSNYEKSRSSYFLKKRKKTREKSNFEFLLEGALWLIDNEKINQFEYDELVKQIIFKYDKATGNEIYSTDRIISSNPYYINNRYLSVFKIEISNPTKSHFIFNENITIESGHSTYKPLPTNLIIEELQRSNLMNVDKAFILERHNLTSNIIIPPNSKFEKLFAIAPIDYKNNVLNISFSNTDKKFKWDIIKDEKVINELYTFYEFNVLWYYYGFSSELGIEFNILKSKPSSVFLVNTNLFINEESLGEEFEIFTLSLYSDKLYFGRNSNMRGVNFIEQNKNRRKIIYLNTEKIESLKKKVKE